MIMAAPAMTVADAWNLIDAIPSAVIAGAPALVAPLASLLTRARDDALDDGDLLAILAVLPVVMGLPWRSSECRERVVACWFSTAIRRAETLAGIALTHRYGHCLIDGEGDGLWVPRRLLSWLPEDLLPAGRMRWKLTPDFPVPVQQRLAWCRQPPALPVGGGDIRPALIAGTLAEVRLAAAAWAARFAWSGQPVADILALGGFDGLTAAALLLHRGSTASGGWQEARRVLGLPQDSGWTGAVLERCGRPDAGRVHQPLVTYAWLTADFEEADGERSSSAATATGSLRAAERRGG
jgi:hypothetical protein